MCGFIGYSSQIKKEDPDYRSKFEFYHKQMINRGPDFQKKILFKNNLKKFNLGFSRLSIQDSSKDANKIFSNERYCLLFNGEIYNKENLKKKYFEGEFFETKTDTELLFKLLIKFQMKNISEIEGIFAFVFIDLEKNIIYLVRDYTGTKPLYYSFINNEIFFSSEAWFLYSLSKKKLNTESVNFYFRFGFPPKEKTLVENVYKVKPNSYLSYDFSKNKIFNNNLVNIGDVKNFEDDVNYGSLISNSIKKNLIGDKKIGVFLSGGIDSSIISLEIKKYNSNIEAYTSIYEDSNIKDNEDLELTKRLCKDQNIKLNLSIIKKKDTFEGGELLKALHFFDEPIANLNLFSSYKQSQHAKENNTSVILTGDGADEIFGGYRKYQTLKLSKKLEFLHPLNKKIRTYKELSAEDIPYHFSNKVNDKFLEKVFKKEFANDLKKQNNHKFLSNIYTDALTNLNFFDFHHWMIDEHNLKLDRSTMANSIEGRVPFQDITILNRFSFEEISKKFNIFQNKILLRKYFTNLPDYILKRKKKGWFLPEQNILKDFLKKNIFDVFSISDYDKNFIFDYKKIYEIYFTQETVKFPRYQFITILFFKIWFDKMIKC